jgi:hypothetical protein
VKIHFYEFTLPPMIGDDLACSGGRVVSLDEDNDFAKCKIISFRYGGGEYYFVVIDALYIGSTLKDKINKLFSALPGSLLVLAATHSHSLPNVSEDHSYFGGVNQAYLQRLEDGIVDFIESYSSFRFESVCSVRTTKTRSKNVTFRRSRLKRPFVDVSRVLQKDNSVKKKFSLARAGVIMSPSSEFPGHELAFSLHLETNLETYNFTSVAVHPTNIKIGSSRDIYLPIEKSYAGQKGIFIGNHGFGADLKLFVQRESSFSLKKTARRILFGDSYPVLTVNELDDIVSTSSIEDHSEYVLGNDSILPMFHTTQISEDIGLKRGGNPLVYTVSIFSFGKIIVISANCEVSSLYYKEFMNVLGCDMFLYPISCADDCVGYLPHYSYIGQGGYEDEKFIKYFGLDGTIDLTRLNGFINRIKLTLGEV